MDLGDIQKKGGGLRNLKLHQQVGCGVDQGFTRAEHSYCLEYKAGGVGGVEGHDKKGGDCGMSKKDLKRIPSSTTRQVPT